ncbi:MAG: single-stranded DNA-binding protein [Clostridiales bacterium]|nr:single-stranded DNA-binding protein [Clostridiales bacterium]
MLNKAILMGRLTGDPELRHTPNNTAVTSFTLAVNRSFSRSGEQQTDFIDIVAWGSTAEFVTKWFHKGMLVAVSGRIQTRNWEDKQGNKRKSVEIVADEVHFAEPKKDTAARPDDTMPGFGIPSGNADFSELADDDGELPF